jgi:hypothetical protein
MPPVKPPTLKPGFFRLHSRALPDLTAGPYRVETEQSFALTGATTQVLETHIEVTAPRFVMPRDQVLSTFPPNQAQGPFYKRLPQIVLKRRTLPWERELDGTLKAGTLPREIPWLALVVLADGECEFLNARPISECVTPGIVLEGRNDSPVGDAIVVTDKVVEQVFPTKDELQLLTHVRAVDITDTELAMGDDDGWLAVVVSSRLPQPGVRYRACLISLEGQYAALKGSAGVEDAESGRARTHVYDKDAQRTQRRDYSNTSRSLLVTDGWTKNKSASNSVSGKTGADSQRRANIEPQVGAMHTTDMSEVDPGATQFVFPVLVNWQFTCEGEKDFGQLMKDLDVGLLDTIPVTPEWKAPAVDEPPKRPPAPRLRPLPRTTATGHIELSQVNRAGESGLVWYRGPLVPHPTGRDAPDPNGRLPLLHSSDQARRIGTDGRENLSLAAAFEIGRLLALAEPRVVAAFLNWRKTGFEFARRTESIRLDVQWKLLSIRELTAGFAARVGLGMLRGLGGNAAQRLGATRPSIDVGCPIAGLDGLDVSQLIASGFGIPLAGVQQLMNPGAQLGAAVIPPVAPRAFDLATLVSQPEIEFGPLHQIVLDRTTTLARDALAGRGTTTGIPDALDRLIEGNGRII